ncbi:MAG: energy transducer TonB [Pseudomonadota bacterium]
MRRTIIALVLAVMFGASAAAQAPGSDTVLENFRAYRAAMARNDLIGAEHAAVLALAASEARDGDGGRTAVLAMNLALVRIQQGRVAEAREPAARALQLAEASGARSGVDPLLARLTLGQAELETDAAAGRARLVAALAEADARSDLNDSTVDAASALGRWFFEHDQLDDARAAYATVVTHSPGNDPLSTFIRARAETAEAAAWLKPGRLGHSSHRAEEGQRLLADAVQLLGPLVAHENGQGELTTLQRVYAQALAWRAFAHLLDPHVDYVDVPPMDPQKCMVQLNAPGNDWEKYYPMMAAVRSQSGVVVVRTIIDADGGVTRMDVVAAAPNELFPTAAQRIFDEVQITRRADALEGCTMAQLHFFALVFRADH